MSPAFSKVLLSVEEHEDVGKLSSKPNARQKGLKGRAVLHVLKHSLNMIVH